MDPATAFQLACGAVQLIGFGCKTAKAIRQIYKNNSALLDANEQLDKESKQVQTTTISIRQRLGSTPSDQLTEDQRRLQRVVQDCCDLNDELLQKLNGLKVSGTKQKRHIPKILLKSMRDKSNIEDIHNRLKSCLFLLNTELLSGIW